MFILFQFTACRLRTYLAYACRAIINRTNDCKKFRSSAWFEFDWQPRKFRAYDLKATGHRQKFGASAFLKATQNIV